MRYFEYLEGDTPDLMDQVTGMLHGGYEASKNFVNKVIDGPDVTPEKTAADPEQEVVATTQKDLAPVKTQAELNAVKPTRADSAAATEKQKSSPNTLVLSDDRAKKTADLLSGTVLGQRLGAEVLAEYGPKLDYLVDTYFREMVGSVFGPQIRESFRTSFIVTLLQGLSGDISRPVAAQKTESSGFSRTKAFQTMSQKNDKLKQFASSFMSSMEPLLCVAGLGSALKDNIILRSNFLLVFEQAKAKNLINQDGLVNGQKRGLSLLDNPNQLAEYLKNNAHGGHQFASELWPMDKSLEYAAIINPLFGQQNSVADVAGIAASVSEQLSNADVEAVKLGLQQTEGMAKTLDTVKKVFDSLGLTSIIKPILELTGAGGFTGLLARFFGNTDDADVIAIENIGNDQGVLESPESQEPQQGPELAVAALAGGIAGGYVEISEDKVQQELDTVPNVPFGASVVIGAAKKVGIPVDYLLTFMKNDSSYGTAGKGAKTNNPGNIGNMDNGSTKVFTNWEEGVLACAEHIATVIQAYKDLCGADVYPTVSEIASGKVEQASPHKGAKFHGVYMTAANGPLAVAKIQQSILADLA